MGDVAVAFRDDLVTTGRRLRIGVGVATIGRPEIISEMLLSLTSQTRPADAVVVCSPVAGDTTGAASAYPAARFITDVHGLPRQRNAILAALDDCDVVLFFDDDFLPSSDYLGEAEAIFTANPDVMMLTGRVLADGIGGPGLELDNAKRILSEAERDKGESGSVIDVYNGYGCNMAVRLAPVRAHGLAFDETLPLYAWLEDVDFSRRLARYGRIVKASGARGVHLGVKRGRQSGVRLGYSQIANPLYLVRKGSCSPRKALYLMSRNMAMNALRAFRPEPYIDRAGRLFGNARALLDSVTGRLHPTRILSM
jgi:GT2 family glycosyltransferase